MAAVVLLIGDRLQSQPGIGAASSSPGETPPATQSTATSPSVPSPSAPTSPPSEATPDQTRAPSPEPTPKETPRAIAVTSQEMAPAPVSARSNASSLWTGSAIIVWGGAQLLNGGPDTYLADGAAYDPVGNLWRPIADGPLSARQSALAVWTGSEVIVWGGDSVAGNSSNGAAFAPAADVWRPIADAPFAWRTGAAAIWTGAEMVIAAAQPRDRLTVAAYDPVGDTWRMLPDLTAPSESGVHLTWTGQEIVLLNLTSGLFRLEADADAWAAVDLSTSEGSPLGPIQWTGDSVAGVALEYLGPGRYGHFVVAWDPATSTWLDLPRPHSSLSDLQRILWADDRVILFGVESAFDADTQEWLSIPVPSLIDRLGGVAVWAGDRLVVWGGAPFSEMPSESKSTGAVFVPAW